MNPSLIPITTETSDRFNRITGVDGMGADTLVSLALDAYELVAALTLHAPELSEWREHYRACLDGSHYCEVA